jgi:tRNA(fMet)-specific endonuclease VapC
VVAGERGQIRLDDLIGDDDDVAIAAITVAELLAGVELADTHRPGRRALVDSIIASIPVEDYDVDVARAHGELLAHAFRSGRRRGAHDLVIAATARARGRIVVTADQGGFDDLPGVAVRLVPRSTRER